MTRPRCHCSRVNMPLLLMLLLLTGYVFLIVGRYSFTDQLNSLNKKEQLVASWQSGKQRKPQADSSSPARQLDEYNRGATSTSITERMRALLKICNVTSKGINILKTKIPSFIRRFKNPCWYEDQELLCLPYMYLVGVAKCGTTDLFKKITLHSHFVEPTIKEPNWISAGRFWRQETLRFYAKTFFSPIAAELTKSEKTNKTFFSIITGEASVSTFEGAHDWPLLEGNVDADEPVYNNPEFIFHINPKAKILINLRNPVDRLWSEYLAFSKNGNKSAKDFHKLVKQEITMYNQCLAQRTLGSCMHDRILAYNATMNDSERKDGYAKCFNPKSIVILRRGVYHVFIKDYLRVFPRDHVLIQRLEDIKEDPYTSLTKTYSFLGLKIPRQEPMKKILKMDVRNSRKPADKIAGAMLPATRKLLYRFYKPHNKALATLLNDDRYNYKDIS